MRQIPTGIRGLLNSRIVAYGTALQIRGEIVSIVGVTIASLVDILDRLKFLCELGCSQNGFAIARVVTLQ